MEQHVTFETAKLLKEAKFPQETNSYYGLTGETMFEACDAANDDIAAPSIGELIAALPKMIDDFWLNISPNYEFEKNGWQVAYLTVSGKAFEIENHISLAEALAGIWLLLAKEGKLPKP